MAIVIEDAQMEQLAQQIAKAEGVTVKEVMRESLLSLVGTRGLATQKPLLRERLAKLAREIDALPPSVGNCNDKDILGYNEYGVW